MRSRRKRLARGWAAAARDREGASQGTVAQRAGAVLRRAQRVLRGAAYGVLGPPARSRPGRFMRRLVRDSLRRLGQAALVRRTRASSPERAIEAGRDELPAGGPVTVIVPIYDAFDDVNRCLEALVRNTSGRAQLLVIDDASPDPRIGELLERYASHSNVEVLRNPENLGFTRTINRGLEHTDGDVVLLNSDTEVTPGWLRRLSVAAASDERIGTVTAVSNNAGAFSVPEPGVDNALPAGLTKDEVGRLVARASLRLRPDTPTANGFCMYVKRALLDEVGGLDVDNFPRGYGEENDFSMRARALEWRHVVDDATFVHHRREASFGPAKSEVYKAGQARLHSLHPDYEGLVRRFVRSPETRRMRARAARAFREGAGRPQLARVLFVLHEGRGGTPMAARDLMGGLADRFECLLLASNGDSLRLRRHTEEGLMLLDEWRLERPWKPMDFTRADYAAVAREVLIRQDVELVHIRHLFRHSFDLPDVAAALDIPVIFSFHDFYMCCPTIHLLDDRRQFCGGTCTPGDGKCRIGSWAPPDLPHLKHGFVHTWKAEVSRRLEKGAAAVTTSPSSQAVHRHALPVLRDRRFEVIEPGRDLEQAQGVARPPRPDEPIRLLLAGSLGIHNGIDFIRQLSEQDAEGRLELHFLGAVPPEYRHLGVQHGRYEPDQFIERAREIRPAFLGIFSIWAETDSYTLSEAWAAGIPVVATDIGAAGDRIAEHGGGWTVPLDPAAAYRRVLEIAADREGWAHEASRATIAGFPSDADMAAQYAELYGSVLEEARAFRPQAGLAEVEPREPPAGQAPVSRHANVGAAP